MKKFLKKVEELVINKKIIFLLSIIILLLSVFGGLRLRRIGYYIIPDPYAIADEHTNVWYGLSLRKNGIPVAWSQLAAYGAGGVMGEIRGMKIYVSNKSADLGTIKNFPNPVVAVQQLDIGKGTEHIRFVQPYIDHPPLGAIILSLGVTGNINSFPDLSSHDMRRMSVYLAVATTLLIFLAGWQLTRSPTIGVLAAAIYGSAPTYLLLSRYAQLENVLSPMFLILFNLLLLLRNKLSNKPNMLILIAAGVFAGLCALTKEIGWFALVFGITMLSFWKKTIKDILTFAIPAVLIGSLYFVWCLYLNAELFANIFLYQGISRGFVGSLNMLAAAFRVGILNFPLDGWWFGGFLAFLLIQKKKEYLPLFVAASVIIFSNLLIGGANYAWYYIPLIPFMCIATAIYIYEIFVKPGFVNIMVFFLVFISSSFYWGYGVNLAISQSAGFQQPFTLYRIFLLLALGAAAVFRLNNKAYRYKKIWYVIMFVILLCLFFLNTKSIYFLSEHWGSGIYPSLYSPGSGFIMK